MIERHGIPHEKCACGRVVHVEMLYEHEGDRICDACLQRRRRKSGKSRRDFERERRAAHSGK